MSFIPPRLPDGAAQDSSEERLEWSRVLLNEAQTCGLKSLRVGRRIDGAKENGATQWLHLHAPSSFQYHLRTVLPNQIVFDLGDNDANGVPTPWVKTQQFAGAVMEACHGLGFPFIAGLSGGKGFHVEVFLDANEEWVNRLDWMGTCLDCNHSLEWHRDGEACRVGRGVRIPGGDMSERWGGALVLGDYIHKGPGYGYDYLVKQAPDPWWDWGTCRCASFRGPPEAVDWRRIIANRIISEANRILYASLAFDLDSLESLPHDGRFIAPSPESVLIREYGERKGPSEVLRKLVWHEGHGPAPPLPPSKEEAYAVAEARAQCLNRSRPNGIPHAKGAIHQVTSWAMELHGRPCPQGPQCHQVEDGWPLCAACPIGGD